MDSNSEYKVGALADLISEGGGGKTLSMASLFTTDKKQKEAAIVTQVEKVEKTNKKATQVEKTNKKAKRVKKVKEAVEGEQDEEDGKDAKSKTPSAQEQVKREDEKEEKERKRDPEQEERTVFVGNLPASATKKQLMKMFGKFGNVETVRFRGAARPDMNTTKKVAVIKRAIHENRHNISAYVRFKERPDAEKASAATNGVKVGDNVLRVDLAANPISHKKNAHDQKMAVFVGNMSYSIEENALHNRFSKCGAISSVRIVRDAATGIGKGFGYVNFASEDSVEIALTLNGSELDGRKIRVTRCVRKTKPIVELPNSNTSRPNTKKPAQAKKVTRKKLRDMSASAASFQGQSFDDDKKTKKGELNKSGKGKKLNRGEKEKKKLSQKLLKS